MGRMGEGRVDSQISIFFASGVVGGGGLVGFQSAKSPPPPTPTWPSKYFKPCPTTTPNLKSGNPLPTFPCLPPLPFRSAHSQKIEIWEFIFSILSTFKGRVKCNLSTSGYFEFVILCLKSEEYMDRARENFGL